MSLFKINSINIVSRIGFKDYKGRVESLGRGGIEDKNLRFRILKGSEPELKIVVCQPKIKGLIESFCKEISKDYWKDEFESYCKNKYIQEGVIEVGSSSSELNNQMYTGINLSKPLYTFSQFIEFLGVNKFPFDDYWIEARYYPQGKKDIQIPRPVLCNKGTNEHGKPGLNYYCFMGPEELITYSNFEKRLSQAGDLLCVPNFREISLEGLPGVGKLDGKNLKSIINGLRDLGYGEGAENNNSNTDQMKKFRKIIEETFEDQQKSSLKIRAVIDMEEKSKNKNNGNYGEGEMEFPERVVRELESNTNVIVEGVAGSGKSHLLESLRRAYYKQEENSEVTYWVAPGKSKKDSEEEINLKESEGFSPFYGEKGSQIEVVVFHPSTSYEEFVSGIRPNFMKHEDEGEFVSREGIFVQMCNWAALNPNHKFLIFIDEINRANTSRVFGDLMLVLEKSKRQEFKGLAEDGRDGALFEASVQKMPGDYVRLQTPIFKNGKEYNKLAVPTNLHVLGTMNTTDRSVGTIDLALRRRFHWITQEPMNDRDELLKALGLSGDKDKTVGFVADWFIHANEVLGSKVGPDARLGHAYFFGKEGDAEAIAEALLNQLKEIAFTFNIDEKVLWGVSKDGKFNKDNPVYCLESKEHIGAVKVITQKDSQEVKEQLWGVQNEGEGLGRRPVVKKPEDKGKSSMTDRGNNSQNEGSGVPSLNLARATSSHD